MWTTQQTIPCPRPTERHARPWCIPSTWISCRPSEVTLLPLTKWSVVGVRGVEVFISRGGRGGRRPCSSVFQNVFMSPKRWNQYSMIFIKLINVDVIVYWHYPNAGGLECKKLRVSLTMCFVWNQVIIVLRSNTSHCCKVCKSHNTFQCELFSRWQSREFFRCLR